MHVVFNSEVTELLIAGIRNIATMHTLQLQVQVRRDSSCRKQADHLLRRSRHILLSCCNTLPA